MAVFRSASPLDQWLPGWLPRVADKFDKLLLPVGMAGFEPATSCSQISSAQSPGVALCRLMGRSPGVIVAGRRSVSPDGCARWLPLWLPPSTAQQPSSCLLNRTSNFAKRDQGIPILATEPVKFANALNLAAFFWNQQVGFKEPRVWPRVPCVLVGCGVVPLRVVCIRATGFMIPAGSGSVFTACRGRSAARAR
jgi:hypothetical protein